MLTATEEDAGLDALSDFPPWHVGQKVLCVDDAFPQAALGKCKSVPLAGEVYTIRAMQTGMPPNKRGSYLGFLLNEVQNPVEQDGREPGFWHTRFVQAAADIGRKGCFEGSSTYIPHLEI